MIDELDPETFARVTYPNRGKFPPVGGECLTWADALRRIWARGTTRHEAGRTATALAQGVIALDGCTVDVDPRTGETLRGHTLAAAHIALQLPIPIRWIEATP